MKGFSRSQDDKPGKMEVGNVANLTKLFDTGFSMGSSSAQLRSARTAALTLELKEATTTSYTRRYEAYRNEIPMERDVHAIEDQVKQPVRLSPVTLEA